MDTFDTIDDLLKRTISDAFKRDIGSDSTSLWLVAVSGGMDSVVLLDALHRFKDVHGKELVVAHYDHQLRGVDSQEDAYWVANVCESIGLRCVREQGDVNGYAKEKGVSIEMAARDLRHAFFVRQARDLGADVLVTAHHGDDQLELILMRWMRGSGPDGLSGMTPFGPSGFDPDMNIWRPFLGINKSDLQAYAKHHGLSWREDETNTDTEHVRNRVRHVLIPHIEREFGSEALDGVKRSADLIAAEHQIVRQAGTDWEQGCEPRPSFAQLQLAVQRELMKLALIRLGIVPEFAWIERLRQCEIGTVHVLPDGLRIIRRSSFPLLERTENPETPMHQLNRKVIQFDGHGGSMTFEKLRFTWQIINGGLEDLSKLNAVEHREVFDADQVGNQIILRHWHEGDRMHLIGARGSSKLQDLFVNAKIDVRTRRHLILAESPGKGIVWVQGFRIGDAFKVIESTVRLLVLEYE